MPPPEAAQDFYRTLQRLQLVLVAAGRRAWARMGPEFDTSWEQIAPALVTVAVATQQRAAAEAASYVPALLAETDQPDEPAGAIVPRAFAGTAADGRPLGSLLYGAVVQAKLARQGAITRDGDVTSYTPGRGVQDALAIGGRWLDGTLATVATDAGRQAVGTEIAQRRGMGWVRMVNPPCCSRCAILAGRWYRWSDGFKRHKRCDCTHIPAAEDRAGDFRTDPQALLDNGLVNGLSEGQRRALADGADFARVVNADRGMYTTTVAGRLVRATTEATTTRGIGRDLGELTKAPGERYRRSTAIRLTPEGIYQVAASQDDAIRLLRANAYITDRAAVDAANVAARRARDAYGAARADQPAL
ncbi:hypothetical protein [Blastococcus xanthinilyticus]|uniref:Uncharacterized protein n=1 Tax=Blastococcus xanthinilyticus TaxID=1564164 RepID=A0A5S5CLJ7_9ACTN|nr:hypothetical protein [Blastococcus xanthinilyticus]TYP82064.1 hypothetical protein BD833_12048 [Blastococcus xanthinilyticus]